MKRLIIILIFCFGCSKTNNFTLNEINDQLSDALILINELEERISDLEYELDETKNANLVLEDQISELFDSINYLELLILSLKE